MFPLKTAFSSWPLWDCLGLHFLGEAELPLFLSQVQIFFRQPEEVWGLSTKRNVTEHFCLFGWNSDYSFLTGSASKMCGSFRKDSSWEMHCVISTVSSKLQYGLPLRSWQVTKQFSFHFLLCRMGKLIFAGLKAYHAERSTHMLTADSVLQMPVLMEQFWEWGQGRKVDTQPVHEDKLQMSGLRTFRAVCRGCALCHCWPLSFTVSRWRQGTKIKLGVEGKSYLQGWI